MIAITTRGDWLKNLTPFVYQWEAKPKPIAPCTRDFSRALSKLQVIARNSDWFIALFAPVVVGHSYYFGIGFSTPYHVVCIGKQNLQAEEEDYWKYCYSIKRRASSLLSYPPFPSSVQTENALQFNCRWNGRLFSLYCLCLFFILVSLPF